MESLPFTAKEYEEREANVRKAMSEKGFDALIVTGPENMYYLSGFRAALTSGISPLMAIVVPAKGELKLITRSLEVRAAARQWTKNPVLFKDHEDPFELLAGILRECGAASGVIGIEETNLSVWRLNRIKMALPQAQFKDESGIVKGLAAIPSETEVEYIKKAAEIANIGFQSGIEIIKEGAYSYEVIAEINNAMYRAGQTDTNVSRNWCWAGPEGGCMHDSSLDYRIQGGDLVTIELGGVHNMYRVNAQGTVYVGNSPSEEIVKTYKMVSDMYKAARDAVKPGAKAGDVYDAVNQVYRHVMGEDYFRRIGGSMSLASFALDLTKGNQQTLNPGVALLVQPLVNEPFLITCAGTILITETGGKELTNPLLELKTV